MKKVVLLAFVLVLLLSTVFGTCFSPLLATNPETKLYVDPLVSTTNPGETFTVDIKIAGVKPLWAYEFYLKWEPALLDVTSVTEGPFLNADDAYSTFFVKKEDFPSMGHVYVVCTLMGEPRTAAASGNGTLATVEFLVKKGGSTSLHLYGTMLEDYDLWEIPHTTEDGDLTTFSIQAAINAASPGYTILVPAGTYYEHVVVNKTVSLIGEDKYNTIIDGSGTGTVMNVTANNVNITGFTIQNSGYGINVAKWSTGNNISYNIITNNYYGIYIYHFSNSNIVSGNTVSLNDVGIILLYSNNNIVSGNTVSNNNQGILFFYSCNSNTVSGNTVSNNTYGINVSHSGNNTLFNNNMTGNTYNFWVRGETDSEFDNSVDVSNTVDGKPIYYLKDVADTAYDTQTNVGTFYLIKCNNITIKDLTLTKNGQGVFFWNTTNSKIENVTTLSNNVGIELQRSSNNTVSGNNVSNNDVGISLYHSSNNNTVSSNIALNNTSGIGLDLFCDGNIVSGNIASNNYYGIRIWGYSENNTIFGNIASNNTYGIDLFSCSNNVVSSNTISNNTYGIYPHWNPPLEFNFIFHNNFINNTEQVRSIDLINVWDGGYPSGGNYWSDYTGVDVKSGPNQDQPSSDGIGDIAYVIDGNNRDNYPLMYPWSAPSPPSYNLTIYSSPTGVTFTVDGVPRTTPWSGIYSDDASVSLVLPETHDGYVWSHWLEDGDPNRIKTVTVDTNITLTALFTPDTTPPTVSIVSPENKTYPVEDVPLTFTVSEPTSWMGYSLDGQTNVTIAGNTTLTSLFDGLHYVVVYANDTAGNMGSSSMVYFTVDTTPPSITNVSQIPLENNVLPEDEVKVNATVTDELSGVKQVTLSYTNGNGTWVTVDMTNLEGNIWNATIPAFPYCTSVTYIVIAEDNVGNTITTEEIGYEFQYHVIPEFPTWTSMLVILIVLTVAIAIHKRKLSKTHR